MNFIDREILAHFRYSSQLLKTAQTSEDIKIIPGVNQILFQGKDWAFVNQFMNNLNTGLIQQGQGKTIAGQPVNFQNCIKNASQANIFSGSLKDLYDLSLKLWGYVTNTQSKSLSDDEVKEIVDGLTQAVNSLSLIEPGASAIKPKLLTALQNWKASFPQG